VGYNFGCVDGLEIHPVASDFSKDGCIVNANHPTLEDCNVGKILIWAHLGDSDYHTEYQRFTPSSSPFERYGVVLIEARFPASAPESLVYFKVEDEDDASPYETDANNDIPNDNFDNFSEYIGLIASNDNNAIAATTLTVTAQVEEVDGQIIKIARAYLRMTKQYSGDNYIVKTSLDMGLIDGSPGEPSDTKETANLVAWKRALIDYRPMYNSGSYINMVRQPSDPLNLIRVNNAYVFNNGETAVIFDKNNSILFEGIILIANGGEKTITFTTDINSDVPKFAGVRVKDNNTPYSINYENRLKDAYGYFGHGDDTAYDAYLNDILGSADNQPSGGAFVEYKIDTKKPIALFNANLDTDPLSIFDFLSYWLPIADNNGRYQVVFGGSISNSAKGFSQQDKNYSIIYDGQGGFSANEKINTFPHELGHQFDIGTMDNEEDHVDSENYSGIIVSNDTFHKCIMTKQNPALPNHHELNSAEFDTHYHHINNQDPVEQPKRSCIGDIRFETWPN